MKYDLIVVGGGPGGLMAAKTAAEDGLKVVLIERKRNVTEINRACSQMFYVRKHTMTFDGPEEGEMHRDGYIEPVSVEYDDTKTRFHFPIPGFSVDYSGPLRPMLNWLYMSPGGYMINGFKWNDQPWGFYYHKGIFLGDLLASVKKAGAEVRTETIGLGAENVKGGVKVRVRGKSGETTLEGRTAIAADGVTSRIVESLGLNKTREMPRSKEVGDVRSSSGVGFVQYLMEGVETGLPDGSWLSWSIPSLNPSGSIMMGVSADNRHTVGANALGPLLSTGASATVEKFINHPRYAHMFRHARVVKKEGFGLRRFLAPIREPAVGNIVIIGDAASPVEAWTQGAVACGYQAVKAIEKELKGQKGYPEYTTWWLQAFAMHDPNPAQSRLAYAMTTICSDDDIDYIWKLFQDIIGIPVLLVRRNSELIKEGRPELYEKLKKASLLIESSK